MGDTIMNFSKGSPWFVPNFTEYPDHFEGTCSDEQEVQEIIEWLQCSHGCDFVFWHDDKSHMERLKQRRIKWASDGVPYTVERTRVLRCQYGKRHGRPEKEEKTEDHTYGRPDRSRFRPSRKVDCKAEIRIRYTMRHENYQSGERKRERAKVSEEIRNTKAKGQLSIKVNLPKPHTHTNHIINEQSGMDRRLRPELKAKLESFVRIGIVKPQTIKQLLRLEVERMGGHDNENDRAYYPTSRDIKNYTRAAKRKNSSLDEVSEENVNLWCEPHSLPIGGHLAMMPGRTTNNPVSSLDEQTKAIQDLSKQTFGSEQLGKRSIPVSVTTTVTTMTSATMSMAGCRSTAGTLTQSTVLTTAGNGPSFSFHHSPMPHSTYFTQPHYPAAPPQDDLGFLTNHPQPETGTEDWEGETLLVLSDPSEGGGEQVCYELSSDVLVEEDQQEPWVEKEVTVISNGLKQVKSVDLLKTQHHIMVREEDCVLPPVLEEMALIVNDFFDKPKIGELERLARNYPRVKNLDKQVVPKMDPEIFNAIDQTTRTADESLQNLQKGVMAAFSAISVVGSLFISRGSSDPELEALSVNVLEALHLLALISNELTTKRRDQLKPYIPSTFASFANKLPEVIDGWLYGGNLAKAAEQCELSKKIGRKILKGKQTPQKNNTSQQDKRSGSGGYTHNKRLRTAVPLQEQQVPQYAPKHQSYQIVRLILPASQQFQNYSFEDQEKD